MPRQIDGPRPPIALAPPLVQGRAAGARGRHLGVCEAPDAPLFHVGPVRGHLLRPVAPSVLEERRGEPTQVLAPVRALDAAEQHARVAHADAQQADVIVHLERLVQRGVTLVGREREGSRLEVSPNLTLGARGVRVSVSPIMLTLTLTRTLTLTWLGGSERCGPSEPGTNSWVSSLAAERSPRRAASVPLRVRRCSCGVISAAELAVCAAAGSGVAASVAAERPTCGYAPSWVSQRRVRKGMPG